MGIRQLCATAVLAAILTGCPGAAPGTDPTIVHTGHGAVRGAGNGKVVRWLGLPYAAPPVGDLRWQPPQEPRKWAGTRDARRQTRACAQGPAGKDASEDCLNLEVTAPVGETPKRPVLVWLHGGGFS